MKPATVLLVDDEVLITEMLTEALGDSGYEVVVANDGETALALIDRAGPMFAALVTDINIGEGTDGWSVAQRARALCPELPVVYTTGGAAGEWAVNGVPGSVLVLKPFSVGKIIGALAAVVSGGDRKTG